MTSRLHIPEDSFLPGGDPDGRLFVHEGCLCRGIHSPHSAFYRDLLDGWKCAALVKAGLVSTDRADFSVEGFDVVARHEFVRPESFPFEWSGRTLKDAALFLCEFARKAAAWGIGLKDAHGYNILFDYSRRPQFIDFCSLVPLTATGGAIHKEFNRYFLNPLYLMQAGRFAQARHLINLGGYETGSKRGGIDDEEVVPHLDSRTRAEYVAARRHEGAMRKHRRFYDLIHFYEREIRRINPQPAESCWSTYYTVSEKYPTNVRFESFDPHHSWQPKQRFVHQLMTNSEAGTVLDVGCAAGWFSQVAAMHGHEVMALDCDEAAIARLDDLSRARGFPILPLFCDFAKMRSLYPLKGHKHIGRFAADIVLVCAVLHHLVFRAAMSFEAIVETLAMLTKKVLVLEFLADTDESIIAMRKERSVPWYSADLLHRALESHFDSIEIVPSTEGMERFLFVCRRPRRASAGATTARTEACHAVTA